MTVNVGWQMMGDGSLRSLGETLLPCLLWVETLNVYQGWPAKCNGSLQVFHSNQRLHPHITTPLDECISHVKLPVTVMSWKKNNNNSIGSPRHVVGHAWIYKDWATRSFSMMSHEAEAAGIVVWPLQLLSALFFLFVFFPFWSLHASMSA